jgi:hypothetical protein
VIFRTDDPTPQVVTSEKLWDLYRNGDTVTVRAKDNRVHEKPADKTNRKEMFDESKKKKNQPR